MYRKSRALMLGGIMFFGGINPVFAVSSNSANFLAGSYSVLSMDFEDEEEYIWGEKTINVGDSTVLKLLGKGDLLPDSAEFVGKTYFKFDIAADEITDKLSLDLNNGDSSLLTIDVTENDGNISFSYNAKSFCSILAGEWAQCEILTDLNLKTSEIIISTNSGKKADKTINLGTENNMLTQVTLTPLNESIIYIDNIEIKRENTASGDTPVITRENGFFKAISKAKTGEILYLAQYRAERLINVAAVENKTGLSYLEAVLPDMSENDDTFMAFLWNSVLTPQEVAEKAKASNLKADVLTLNGELSTDISYAGGSTTFSAQLPPAYTSARVDVYSGNECVKSTEGTVNNLSVLIEKSGKYTAWLYAIDGARLIPAAKTDFFVYPAENADDTFIFQYEKPYYVRNGEKLYFDETGYVPLLWDGHIYLDSDTVMSLTGIEINDTGIVYKGEVLADNTDSVAKKNNLYSFGDICSYIGYKSEISDESLCITKAQNVNVSAYNDLLNEYMLKDSIDGNVLSWNGLYYPNKWGYFNWSNSSQGKAGEFGACFDDKTDGENSFFVSAVSNLFAALTYSKLNSNFDGYGYAISFDVKLSDDYKNIVPFVALSVYKDNEFLGMPQGSSVNAKSGEWTRVTSYITKWDLDKFDFDRADLLIGTKATVNGDTAGKVYFDNVTVKEISILREATEAEIACEAFGAWHTLGDTVVYSPMDKNTEQFDKIYGAVYDIDQNKLFEKTISKREFLTKGWKYTPDTLGYYETEFYGIRKDGSRSLIVNCYTNSVAGSYEAWSLARRSFAVVDGTAKPMSERSDFLLLSDSGTSEEHLRLAEMIGFSGIRIHAIMWGTTAGGKGFHTAKNTFDWTEADKQINNVNKIGFNNVIANVFSTPTWAVTNDEPAQWTICGLYYKNCYAPDQASVTAEGFGAFTEKYKNALDGIEVWNEPHYGLTAFWRDSPEHFKEIAKTAYSAIKAKAPGITVYSAGFNQAEQLFGELMQDSEFRSSFDAISYHGRYDDVTGYRDILNEYNMNDISLINSEGYFYAYYKKNTPKDFRVNCMSMYMNYLEHIKTGADMAGIFEITENTLDEKRVAKGEGHTMGLFRDYPYCEPRQGAVAAYNLFKNIGKELEYVGEYDFGAGRKAVAINSDGETQVYLWNAYDEDFALPEELSSCLLTESEIIDFEGKTSDPLSLKSKRMYCIKNVSQEELSKLTVFENTALNSNYVPPYYTCQNEHGETVEQYTAKHGVFTEGQIFDFTDYSENEGTMYNSDDFEWVQNGDAKQDINASCAVSADDDGVYIIAKVTDDNYYTGAEAAADIMDYDGIRFGIDCYGRLRARERSEFFAGMVNGKPTLYKYHAADKYEAGLDNWSDSETVLSDNYISIVQNENGETIYKIYLPNIEIYPFVYRTDERNTMRFALSVSDNDNGIKKGELRYGRGLDSNTPEVWKYAELSLGGVNLNTSLTDNVLKISGRVFDDSERVAIKVEYGDSLYNFKQIDNITDGSYEWSLPIDYDGRYKVTCTSLSGCKKVTYIDVVKGLELDLKIENGRLIVSGTVENEVEYIAVMIKCNGEINNYEQVEPKDGIYSIDFPAEKGNAYTVTVSNENGVSVSKKIMS